MLCHQDIVRLCMRSNKKDMAKKFVAKSKALYDECLAQQCGNQDKVNRVHILVVGTYLEYFQGNAAKYTFYNCLSLKLLNKYNRAAPMTWMNQALQLAHRCQTNKALRQSFHLLHATQGMLKKYQRTTSCTVQKASVVRYFQGHISLLTARQLGFVCVASTEKEQPVEDKFMTFDDLEDPAIPFPGYLTTAREVSFVHSSMKSFYDTAEALLNAEEKIQLNFDELKPLFDKVKTCFSE